MRFFRLNSFSVIGLILVITGIYGAIKGGSFQFDAGLPSEKFEWVYYVIVGALMIVNGIVLPKPIVSDTPDTKPTEPKPVDPPSNANAPANTN